MVETGCNAAMFEWNVAWNRRIPNGTGIQLWQVAPCSTRGKIDLLDTRADFVSSSAANV